MNRSMIEAHPMGICSWDYTVNIAGKRASLLHRVWGESGSIFADARHMDIVKQGSFSGHWMLEEAGRVIATAQKTSAFTRSSRIVANGSACDLRADSAFTRMMRLSGEGYDCVYAPVHPFTRRATISGSWQDDAVMIFGFWLVILMWRRAARHAAA